MKKGKKFKYKDNVYYEYWQLLPIETIVKYVLITQQYFNEYHKVYQDCVVI
jgi:hypothetical protein